MHELTATVLVDNMANNALSSEWGLAIYIEYHGKKILLDTGASGRFCANAEALGIDLAAVDFGVLSHAHFDHSDGMEHFFRLNETAPFYLQREAKEDCYGKKLIFRRYIGIEKGLLERRAERIRYVDGRCELCEGVTLLPHTTEGLAARGKAAHMVRRVAHRWVTDDFSHEQTLVFATEKGLVIFNSCSHGGVDNILQEVRHAFPGQHIHAYLGGFHLFEAPEDEVRSLAARIRSYGVDRIVTGHCTGEKSFAVLKEELTDAEQMYGGFRFEVS